jgi:RNA-binding protein
VAPAETPARAATPGAATLSGAQRKQLRGLAHGLDPLVQLGRDGLDAGVLDEIDRALERHELVKVRFGSERDERAEAIATVADRLGCAVAGAVGRIAILYRQHPDPKRRRVRLD